MKDTICLIAGIVGGFIATLLGGWDSALATLVVFMGIDFVTGIVTAAMGKSKHSKTGKLTVKKGLKKGTYRVKVQIKSAAKGNYTAGSRTVTVTVRVK